MLERSAPALTHDALDVPLFSTVYPLLQVTLFFVPPPHAPYSAQDADVLVFPATFVQSVLRDCVASVYEHDAAFATLQLCVQLFDAGVHEPEHDTHVADAVPLPLM